MSSRAVEVLTGSAFAHTHGDPLLFVREIVQMVQGNELDHLFGATPWQTALNFLGTEHDTFPAHNPARATSSLPMVAPPATGAWV